MCGAEVGLPTTTKPHEGFRLREDRRFFEMAVGEVCSSLGSRRSMAILELEYTQTLPRGETHPCSGSSQRGKERASWCPSFVFRNPG